MRLGRTTALPKSANYVRGAGTGGATKHILSRPQLGLNSHTYTDIPTDFFQQARAKFAEFDTGESTQFDFLDIRWTRSEKGFKEHPYDLIIAFNVLHATPKLEETMTLEINHREHGRLGFLFGLFPDRWAGVDDGRILEPFVSYDRWDAILKRVGFSGIKSRTLDGDTSLFPTSVFSTSVQSIASLDDLASADLQLKSTFVVLSGIDVEIFAHLDEAKFKAVKNLLFLAGKMQWLTEIDWKAEKPLLAKIRPIDSGNLFVNDKTYLLVGLAGDLGRSLARWMVLHGARYGGAQILHERFSDPDSSNQLDFFVMFSSIVAVSGQASYSAANCSLEALAQQRLSKGLTHLQSPTDRCEQLQGSTVDIGAVYGVGFVTRAELEEDFNAIRFMFDSVEEDELHTLFAEAVVSVKQALARFQNEEKRERSNTATNETSAGTPLTGSVDSLWDGEAEAFDDDDGPVVVRHEKMSLAQE
ncbi:beta-ketoacyl synthase domain-containing protein [Colletotrichum sp. SAR 10_75]|nr:beta-ketoacyl synthase domain-containing protein [Colletotrichum sp. SAR 10_75]